MDMKASSFSSRIKNFLRQNVVLLCLALLIVFFSFKNPAFLSYDNIITVLRQGACTGILAVGLAHVLFIGGIDLSIGNVVSFISVLLGVLTVERGMPVGTAVLICVAAATAVGTFAGFIIHTTRMPPLIGTLAIMNVAQGLAYITNDGMPIYEIPEIIRYIGQEAVLGIPIPVIIWVVTLIISGFTLVKTKFGRSIFAVGSNEEAARLSGINTFFVRVVTYAICGLYAGIGGIVMTGRLNSAQTNAGQNLYIDALTACVVGGISLSGGEGKVSGIIIGVIIMAALANGMVAIGLNSYWQLICKGMLMLLAVGFDSYQSTKKATA